MIGQLRDPLGSTTTLTMYLKRNEVNLLRTVLEMTMTYHNRNWIQVLQRWRDILF